MSVEQLLNECGGYGRYQILITIGIFIHKVLAGWSMLQMSYSGYVPDWYCEVGSSRGIPSNDSDTLKVCTVNNNETGYKEKACQSFLFDGPSRTIVTEWDLVCDDKWVKATVTSIQMAGVLVGSLVAGQLSDSFGRKKTLFGFALVQALFNIAAGFAPNWESFAVFRFFIGTGIGAILVVTIPFGMEFMPIKWRPLTSVVPHWHIGIFTMILAGALLENWRYMQIINGALGIPAMIGWFFVPESARWLTIKGRKDEAEKIFDKIAAINGRPPPKHAKAVLQKIYLEEQELKSSGKKYTYWDLINTRKTAKLTVILCYVWFMMSLVAYGISFGISALSGNLYLNIFLMIITEIPFNLLTLYTLNVAGRKWTNITLQVLAAISAGACLGVKLFVPEADHGWWITGLSISCRTFLGSSWTVMQTWTGELYPTVIRSLGYGLVNTAARAGGIVTPFAVDLDNHPLLAYAIIFTMEVVGITVTFFLSDTKDKLLADSLTSKTTPTIPPEEMVTPTNNNNSSRSTDLYHHDSSYNDSTKPIYNTEDDKILHPINYGNDSNVDGKDNERPLYARL